MSARQFIPLKSAPAPTHLFAPVRSAALQRKCACGATTGPSGDCETCCEKKVQRHPASPYGLSSTNRWASSVAEVPPVVHEVLRSPGQPLDAEIRAFFEPRFGHDFSDVRVHHDSKAAESAQAVQAQAYTVARNVVFDCGAYAPGKQSGRELIAHELAHVVQQESTRGSIGESGISIDPSLSAESDAQEFAGDVMRNAHVGGPFASAGLPARPASLQRATVLGTKVKHTKGTTAPFKKVQCSFDGADFVMEGDGKAVISTPAQSGRPYSVSAKDAKDCKGSTSDSYMNNPRYVGIKDNGPIPEGEYKFKRSDMTTFSAAEQLKMSLAKPGTYTDPSGSDLHGDWGAARAALAPVKIHPSPFCGDTSKRSGFYLHGGSMPGSSGCIDVGNTAVMDVVNKLDGFTSPVPVKVKYTKAAPTVGAASRAAGRFMYPKKKDASLWDRLKSAAGADED